MTERAQLRLIFVLLGVVCLGVTAMMAISALQKEATSDGARHVGDGGKGDGAMDVGTPGAGKAGATIFDQPLPLRRFALTDQLGQPFGSAQLDGKVWIASFVFTRCPTVCPRVIAQTARLQEQFGKLKDTAGRVLGEQVMLVSISVDPLHDSPKVLRDTADLWNADKDRWRFLTTSDREHMWDLIRAKDGFRQTVGEAPPKADMPIVHTSKYVLVDQRHHIRGFYDSLEETDRQRMMTDVLRLIEANR